MNHRRPSCELSPATARRARVAGVLSRLKRDTGGNTLAIVAAALIPLLAMIGSGVDMSRAYMAQNRLRQACDAGALAGRRLLTGATVTPEITAETTKYFNFNFPQRMFDSAVFTPTITVPATGTVTVSARTTVPTTIMRLFGYQTLNIAADCAATQDFVATDVALVLDLSGSMNCPPGVGGGCAPEQYNSKLSALRDASKSLYDTLEDAQNQLHDNNLRLRYGFVTYNSAVNVGRLVYAKNSKYLVDKWDYQSRTVNNLVDATPYFNNSTNCASAFQYSSQAPAAGYESFMGGWWDKNKCWVAAKKYGLPYYTYGLRNNVDVKELLKPSTAVHVYDKVGTAPLGNLENPDPSAQPATVWNGCIEERQTNNTAIDGGASVTAPASALDLDIDKIPSDDASRWRPMWPELVYDSGGRRAASYCPTEARRLREYYNDKASFTAYVDSLRAEGSTYHDLGIIWGARFLSSGGIFKSATPVTNNQFDPDNPEKIRGFSVKKYMIFMTDGDMAPSAGIYSSYGVENMDRRVTGTSAASDPNLTNRHLQRFRMACNAAKSKGISIWVIAFATTLTNDMQDCASSPSQAAGLSTKADLIAKFREIGTKIGSLRLSQ